jgi:GntR family phosphonate transport system transcriptional regulator
MPESDRPVYQQIADELRQNIRHDIYQVGDRLPTEMQLAERFGVNRHTLRQAIGLLRQEGVVRVDRGRGTFVVSPVISYPIGKRVRYNDSLKAQGFHPNVKVLQTVEMIATGTIAETLEVQEGSPVLLLERLSLADNQPISLCSSYFPGHRVPAFLQHLSPESVSISMLMKEYYNFDHLRRITRISAQPVKPQDAQLMELPLSAPILMVQSVNINQYGEVIEYGITRFRGDRMELVFETPFETTTDLS